jgi:hypothetical protein
MFGHDKRLIPQSFFEEFENNTPSSVALDEFKSTVIIAYERALDEGISSGAALAAMLDLMSVELKRCVQLAG